MKLNELTICEMLKDLEVGKFSVVELAEDIINQIQKRLRSSPRSDPGLEKFHTSKKCVIFCFLLSGVIGCCVVKSMFF